MNRFGIITSGWPEIAKKTNAIIVSPKDDLAAKYAWLKSADRNVQMGALSAVGILKRFGLCTVNIHTLEFLVSKLIFYALAKVVSYGGLDG